MKLIIAGSRHLDPRLVYMAIEFALRDRYQIDEVVSGRASRGTDKVGEQWALDHGIPVRPFPADWKKFGLSAGHIRNAAMADYGDHLLLVWDGKSRGSRGMKECMIKRGKPYEEVILQNTTPASGSARLDGMDTESFSRGLGL